MGRICYRRWKEGLGEHATGLLCESSSLCWLKSCMKLMLEQVTLSDVSKRVGSPADKWLFINFAMHLPFGSDLGHSLWDTQGRLVKDIKSYGCLRTLTPTCHLLSDETGEKGLHHCHQSEMGISLSSKRIALLSSSCSPVCASKREEMVSEWTSFKEMYASYHQFSRNNIHQPGLLCSRHFASIEQNNGLCSKLEF